MTQLKLNSHIFVRVTSDTKEAFNDKANRFSDPSDVLRELISAFIEDRLTIKPPEGKEDIYNVGK